MRRLLLTLVCIPFLFSCEESQEKNNMKSENSERGEKDNLIEIIKDPCDLMSYMIEIFLDLEDMVDKYENIDALEKDDRKRLNDYIFNIKEAWTYSIKKFPSFDVGTYEDCDEWQKFYKSGYYKNNYSPFDKVNDFFPDLMDELDDHINRMVSDTKKEDQNITIDTLDKDHFIKSDKNVEDKKIIDINK